MTNLELQKLLKAYPSNMQVKIYERKSIGTFLLLDYESERLNSHASDDKLDDETGELIKGQKERVLVINSPVE